jgi:uncharacterized damage-inducible protein DinB
MTEVNRILDEYDRVMQGNAWHGDPIWQILNGISAECAAHRANAGTHTIWQIVMHMTFWESVAVRRLAGQKAGLDEALNFPAQPEPTEANWQTTRDELRASNLKLREALAKLDATMLDTLSAAGKRTFYDEAHGVIQHDVYHAGQIALLKKCFQPHSRSAGL